MSYILYKSYILSLEWLQENMYENMSREISKLNYHHPIHVYVENIPSIAHINMVYAKLGIIDYNDYIYNIFSNSQGLQFIIAQNPVLEAKTSSIVLADNIYQNTQMIAELDEHLLKRLLTLSTPLIITSLLLAGICVVEHVDLNTIINVV